jgi:tetratricopeptide (TPR) repeat protein
VTSRTSVMTYKGTAKPLSEIAVDLRADWFVEGGFETADDLAHESIRLLRGDTGKIVWSESFERKPSELRDLQSHIAGVIAEQVGGRLTPSERASLSMPRTADPRAFSLIVSGRGREDLGTEASLNEAIGYFRRAIDLDPGSAQAHAGLADAYYGLAGFYADPRDVLPQARAAALEAIDLDPQLAEPHATLGIIHVVYDWDAARAEEAFRTALRLNPSLPRARLHYAALLTTQGRHDEATQAIRQALDLDPRSVRTHVLGALFLLFTRRYDEAIETASAGLALEPDAAFALAWQGVAYAQQHRYQEALANLERASDLDQSLTIKVVRATVEAAAGHEQRARSLVSEVEAESRRRYFCPYEIGSVYATLGDADRAMLWFTKAAHEHADCIAWLGVEPWTDPVRSDARYHDLLGRIGLYVGPLR